MILMTEVPLLEMITRVIDYTALSMRRSHFQYSEGM